MNELIARLRRLPRQAGILLLAALVINVLGLASSIYVMQVLGRYVPHGVGATLATLSVGALIAVAGELVFRHLRLGLANEIVAQARDGVVDTTFRAVLDGGTRKSAAERLQLLRALGRAESTLGGASLAALSDLPFSLLFLLILALLSWPVGVVATLFIALGGLYAWLAARRSRESGAELNGASASADALAQWAAAHSDTFRHFRLGEAACRRWNDLRRRLNGHRDAVASLQARDQAVGQSLQAVMGIAVIATGAMLAVDGRMEVGAIVGANIIAARALAPLTRITAMTEDLRRAALTLVQARMVAEQEEKAAASAILPAYSGALRLHGVGLHEKGGALPLFSGLEVDIPAGSVSVVTGRNGAGKSSLLRLMAGLQPPSQGAILADGLDLRLADPVWWRGQVSYLPQEPFFPEGSVAQCLRQARPQLGDGDVEAILAGLGLDEYLRRRGTTAEMVLADGGVSLPDGVRRRLGLARALALDAPLYLLDEPTEGLDREGRALVYGLLVELARRGRTLVMASHDEKLLAGAGMVIDLDRLGHQGEGA